MIRTDKIQTGLFGGVGFRNPTLTGYNIVDSTNQESSSGLYFQDGSELVTIKNIKDTQENADISDSDFNTLLTNMQKSVVLDVCNKVINGQSDFISSVNVLPFEKSFDATIEHKSKFVGFEIEPSLGNIACKIPYVELSFNEEVTFNLYLYNSNLPKSPVQTKSVTTTAGESKIVDLGWIIADDATYKGGTFYLGYFDDDLGTAKAYKKDHDSSNVMINAPYFKIWPLTLGYTGTTIDIENENSSSLTFGLNFGMDVYNDYTELIIRNKSLFWNAIQLQMHEKVLSKIKYSTRTNATERVSVGKIDFELFGNREAGILGVSKKLENAISTLRKSLFYVPRISRGTLG